MSKRGTPERTRKALQQAISAVDEALAAGPSDHPTGGRSQQELVLFKGNLQRMINDVLSRQSNALMEPSPVPPMGHVIADQWPMALELGDVILKAEEEYKAFIERKENEK